MRRVVDMVAVVEEVAEFSLVACMGACLIDILDSVVGFEVLAPGAGIFSCY